MLRECFQKFNLSCQILKSTEQVCTLWRNNLILEICRDIQNIDNIQIFKKCNIFSSIECLTFLWKKITCYCDCLQRFSNVVFSFALVVTELQRAIVLCANVLNFCVCLYELAQFVTVILLYVPHCGNGFTLSEETERRVRLCLCLTLKVKVRVCFFWEFFDLQVTI